MKTRAFTLIELLVVVLIIGILAAIAVPQYRKAIVKSRFSTLKFMVKAIVEAQEVYYLANGKYSPSFSQLDITMPNPKEIIEETAYTDYIYDWGFCRLTDYSFSCKNTKSKISLEYYYQKARITPNLKVCTVSNTNDSNDYRNHICKEETKAESGTPYNDVIFWYYQ